MTPGPAAKFMRYAHLHPKRIRNFGDFEYLRHCHPQFIFAAASTSIQPFL